MARAKKPEVIVETLSKGKQEMVYTLVEKLAIGEKTFKVKYDVCSDSYEFQCYARAHVWSETECKWHPVHGIHYAHMKTEAKLYYMPPTRPVTIVNFAQDVMELRRIVTEILG